MLDGKQEKHPDKAKEIDAIDFLTFPVLEPSIEADVEYLKQHPLLVDNTNITGWVYEVETGKVQFLRRSSSKASLILIFH